MAVDFFQEKCQIRNIREKRFGICDEEDTNVKTPAYIETRDESKWIAIVKNETENAIHFTAVDNCVVITRPDGNMENRCDAILRCGDHIVFVELKDQQKDWITHAVDEQLQNTIDHFKENHNIQAYKYRRAFVCNRKHPNFKTSYKDKMNTFYKKNGIRLNLMQEIVFDK